MRRARLGGAGVGLVALVLLFFGGQYVFVSAPNASHLDLLGSPLDAHASGVALLYGMLRRSLGATYLSLAAVTGWVALRWLRALPADGRAVLLAHALLWPLLAWSNFQVGHTSLSVGNLILFALVFVSAWSRSPSS